MVPHVPRTFCHCWCHKGLGEPWRPDGVDTAHVIEAALACDRCRNWHSAALLATLLANETPLAPRVKTPWIDPRDRPIGDTSEGDEG
jgi:hypothetical protein